MSLTDCPYCGHPVSTKAVKCPACGRDLLRQPTAATGSSDTPAGDVASWPIDTTPAARRGAPSSARSGATKTSAPGAKLGDAPGGSPNPLAVALIPQQTRMWCWAASCMMIVKYFKPSASISQCQEANSYYGNEQTDCCSSPTPNDCVNGGWPNFGQFGFSSQRTADSGTGGLPLSWNDLKNEIDNGRPVAFSWHRKSGGGHMMVACGYQVTDGKNYVIVNDPWPPDQGAQYPIDYDMWANGPTDYEHWYDFYDIQPTAAPAGPSGAFVSANAPEEAPGGPMDQTVRAQSRGVAEQFMNTAVTLVGKNVPGGGEPFLDEGLPVVHLGLNELRLNLPGVMNPLEAIHDTEVTQVIYPVKIRDKVLAATLAQKQDNTWTATNTNPVWTQILSNVRLAHSLTTNTALSSYFVVDSGALGIHFVAYRKDGKLRLIPTLDDPGLGFKKGQEIDSDKAYEILRNVARTHSGGPA